MSHGRGLSGVDSTAHGHHGWNLHGGSGAVPQQGRAAAGGSGEGELHDRASAAAHQALGCDRASKLHGESPDQDRGMAAWSTS